MIYIISRNQWAWMMLKAADKADIHQVLKNEPPQRWSWTFHGIATIRKIHEYNYLFFSDDKGKWETISTPGMKTAFNAQPGIYEINAKKKKCLTWLRAGAAPWTQSHLDTRDPWTSLWKEAEKHLQLTITRVPLAHNVLKETFQGKQH